MLTDGRTDGLTDGRMEKPTPTCISHHATSRCDKKCKKLETKNKGTKKGLLEKKNVPHHPPPPPLQPQPPGELSFL